MRRGRQAKLQTLALNPPFPEKNIVFPRDFPLLSKRWVEFVQSMINTLVCFNSQRSPNL